MVPSVKANAYANTIESANANANANAIESANANGLMPTLSNVPHASSGLTLCHARQKKAVKNSPEIVFFFIRLPPCHLVSQIIYLGP